MGSNKHPDHTDEEIAFIQKWTDDGHSAAAIAAIFGKYFDRPITRKAVIGLWYRKSVKYSPRVQLMAQDMKIRTSNAWLPLPGTTPVTLFEREEGACKWPVDERDELGIYKFCGVETQREGCPWCEDHRKIAYQPPRAR